MKNPIRKLILLLLCAVSSGAALGQIAVTQPPASSGSSIPTKIIGPNGAQVSVEDGNVGLTSGTGGAVNVTSGDVYIPTIIDYSTAVSPSVSAAGHYKSYFDGTGVMISKNGVAYGYRADTIASSGTVGGLTLTSTNVGGTVTTTLGGTLAVSASSLPAFTLNTPNYFFQTPVTFASGTGTLSLTTGNTANTIPYWSGTNTLGSLALGNNLSLSGTTLNSGTAALGSNAYTSTAYVAASGGTLTGGTLAGTTTVTGTISSPVLNTGTGVQSYTVENASTGGFAWRLGATDCRQFFDPWNTNFIFTSFTKLAWSSASNSLIASSTLDTIVLRDAANTLALRNGTNAQTFNDYGTYTDSSNYRRGVMKTSTSGVLTISSEGLGTGATGNSLVLAVSGTTSVAANATGVTGIYMSTSGTAANNNLYSDGTHIYWKDNSGTQHQLDN